MVHLFKIQKPSCRKTLIINSFPTRCINLWNSLSEEIVSSDSVLKFKTSSTNSLCQLDIIWLKSAERTIYNLNTGNANQIREKFGIQAPTTGAYATVQEQETRNKNMLRNFTQAKLVSPYSFIVQTIFYSWSFEIKHLYFENSKIIIQLNLFSTQI